MNWRQTACILLSFAAILISGESVKAYEEISSFRSHVVVNPNTDLHITETIEYQTDEDKHGIYRYLPERYNQDGLNLRVKVDDVKVTDEDERPHPFTTDRKNGSLYLKIGDPDKTFSGERTFVISYLLRGAVFPYQVEGVEHPRLVLDITGEGWQVPIASAAATITAPASILESHCYSGAYGTNSGTCLLEKLSTTTLMTIAEQPIGFNDNLTASVVYEPNGGIILPSKWQRNWKFFWDNLGLIIIIFPAAGMIWWWWEKGRDRIYSSLNVFANSENQPQTTWNPWQWRPIPMVYEPFTDISPAEAGALLNESVDIRHIIADIIFLAAKKYLTIERVETKKLIGKQIDYRLTKLSKKNDLSEPQAKLLTALFEERNEVLISELKGTFYTQIDKLQSAYMTQLTKKKFFDQNPRQVRGKAFAIAGAIIFILFAWMFNLLELGLYWSLPLTFFSSVLTLIAAYNMPAKTALGNQYFWRTKGLQQSIKRGAWREKIKEKHLFIEEVFPFAIALNVVSQLTQDMRDLAYEPPDYLGAGWTTATFNQFSQSFVNQVSSNLSYNPNSSSSGGSSSGGGVGGGGGGSW